MRPGSRASWALSGHAREQARGPAVYSLCVLRMRHTYGKRNSSAAGPLGRLRGKQGRVVGLEGPLKIFPEIASS